MKQAIVQDISDELLSQLDIHLEHWPLDFPLTPNHLTNSCSTTIARLRGKGFDSWQLFSLGTSSVQERHQLSTWHAQTETLLWYCLAEHSFIAPAVNPPTFIFKDENRLTYLYPEVGDLLLIPPHRIYRHSGEGTFLRFRQGG